MVTPYNINNDFMAHFGAWIKKEAKQMKDNAGFNGSHSDGGAGNLEQAWACYLAGYNNTDFPYSSYLNEYQNSIDPEYAEYIRLKKKFEE